MTIWIQIFSSDEQWPDTGYRINLYTSADVASQHWEDKSAGDRITSTNPDHLFWTFDKSGSQLLLIEKWDQGDTDPKTQLVFSGVSEFPFKPGAKGSGKFVRHKANISWVFKGVE